MTQIRSYLAGWNFMRALRLILGVIIVVQGVQMADWSYILLGGLFSLMPVFNIGCCGNGACSVPPSKQVSKETEVHFEELTK